MIANVLSVTFPFFALVLAGYGAGRWHVIDAAGVNGISRFVFYFALPCLLFGKLAETPASLIFDGRFLAAYITAALATFAVAAAIGRLLFKSRLGEASIIGLAASYSNIGFMGIPLLTAAVGDFVAVPLALILTIDVTLLVPFGMLLIEMDKGEKGQAKTVGRAMARAVLTNPLVIAIVSGIGVTSVGLTVPAPAWMFVDLLGRAAGPCAMFALGAILAGRPVAGQFGMTATMTLGKLVLHPLVMTVIMTAFGVAGQWRAAAVLAAGMPIAAVLFVVAQQYDVRPAVASSAVMASTALSILTLGGLMVFMGETGLLALP